MNIAYITIAYGVLVIAGGIFDYFKTKRLSSVGIGGITGLIIAGCGVVFSTFSTHWSLPRIITIVATVAMLVFFISRFLRRESPSTDILMCGISLLVIICLIIM